MSNAIDDVRAIDGMAEWTDNQRCPVCKKDPESCDYCSHCEIDLVCAQSKGGLALAELRHEDGERVLYLARAEEA